MPLPVRATKFSAAQMNTLGLTSAGATTARARAEGIWDLLERAASIATTEQERYVFGMMLREIEQLHRDT